MSSERVHIPREYYKFNKFVTIGADVMFVAGVPIFVTYFRKIQFAMGEFLPRRNARQLANSLKKKYFVCTHVGALLSNIA